MKKIEKMIGDSFFLWLFFHKQLCVDLLFFVEKIPGLESLVAKISDSISGKFFLRPIALFFLDVP